VKYHAFITRPAALEIAKEILTKQKGDKLEALSMILEDYKVMLDKDKDAHYLIIPHAKCRTCGGVVLKRVHVFSRVTCGGGPVVGCPVCNTFSSGKMLSCREDIERTHGNEEIVSAEEAADTVIQNLRKKGFDVISRENIVADIKAIREREKTGTHEKKEI
jgi:hypothetical protein